MVNDAQGKKMSKSKGNVINPLDLTKKYGTDALRMALVVGNTPGTDLSLREDKVKGYKNFANKIWNITRFVLESTQNIIPEQDNLTETDKEIINKFEELTREITQEMDEFKFYIVAEKLYHYIWHEFADVIIEKSKPIFSAGSDQEKKSRAYTLKFILNNSLKLLHPFMPFITEEIWSHIEKEKPLIITSWPTKK
jgi:valyl-tRNA synthetase